MTSSELIQISTGLIGSLCFGILFNMRGKRLIAAAVGGLLSWGLFVVLSHFILNEPINYFIVAAVVSLYSEIMARILKNSCRTYCYDLTHTAYPGRLTILHNVFGI